MGAETVRAHLARRLCTQVGVLGFPDAGKTAALVSLYLLVSSNKLEGFEFRDCRTLMAFEQISRGARAWDKDSLPEQITNHTESVDGRTAGFLHFKLADLELQRDLEFFVPDLPGEWTTTLADSNRIDRLEFLRAVDVIWLFVNGQHLANAEARGHAVHRAEIVVKRTAALLGYSIRPSLALVITRRDEGQTHQASVDSILQCATSHGFAASVIEVASFSNHPDVTPAGTGLVELVKTLRPQVRIAPEVLLDERRSDSRFSMNFRRS
ncbi:TRAFAC clade GTPase domain-containing protein [Paraburkholderia sp. GAS41]|uniref:TRAFAC clade GTPase domain-containing protein n=1 Tax=Paraburkholderia sp. GAS41 TaxID=3035134 RepID=UPI003D1B016C